MDVAAAIAIGLAAGMVAGMLGVGGGVIFVPGLVLFLGLSQLEAQATSLLAIIPVSIVGAVQQHRYGNLRLREGVLVGVLAAGGALAGVVAGTWLQQRIPPRWISLGFAALLAAAAVDLLLP